MADWASLRSYIKSNYKIVADELNSLTLHFEAGGGRTQVIVVSISGEVGGSEWAEISTAVCAESEINPRDALIRNSQMIVGGLALIQGGPVVYRHSFPLVNLDLPEFDIPLRAVVVFGDRLEQELAGGDRF
jgi:hypothetical protein